MWELDCEGSWAPKNWCFWTVVLEKTLESSLDCKEIQPVNPKGNQSWIFIGKTCWSWNSNSLASWCEELTHWKRPWCWERLKVGGEGDDRGWDAWMASPTRWTWVWVSSGSWWWTGKPGVQQSMGSQSDTTKQLNGNEYLFLKFWLYSTKYKTWQRSHLLNNHNFVLYFPGHKALHRHNSICAPTNLWSSCCIFPVGIRVDQDTVFQ